VTLQNLQARRAAGLIGRPVPAPTAFSAVRCSWENLSADMLHRMTPKSGVGGSTPSLATTFQSA
jgi:hypothetical protein